MNRCPQCGAIPRSNALFCDMCGYQLSSAGQQTIALPAPPAYDSVQQVQAIIDAYRMKLRHGHIHIFPDISSRRLHRARTTYALDVTDATALLLADNTLFNTGKFGILITTSMIYARDLFEKPFAMPLASLKAVEIQQQEWSTLYIDQIKVASIQMINKETIRIFETMLQEIAALFQPSSAPTSISTTNNAHDLLPSEPSEVQAIAVALFELKKLYDNGILTTMEYEDSKRKYLDAL